MASCLNSAGASGGNSYLALGSNPTCHGSNFTNKQGQGGSQHDTHLPGPLSLRGSTQTKRPGALEHAPPKAWPGPVPCLWKAFTKQSCHLAFLDSRVFFNGQRRKGEVSELNTLPLNCCSNPALTSQWILEMAWVQRFPLLCLRTFP